MGNREVQLAAVSLLNKLTSELILLVTDNGRPFALFISDLFNRTKLQKVILHSLLSGVHSVPNDQTQAFTKDILRFNDEDPDTETGISVNSQAFQVEIMKLVLSLVMLEEILFQKKFEDADRPRLPYIECTVMKYNPDHPFSEQPMFLAAILSALKQQQLRDVHYQWTGLVISCLPFLGTALTQVVTSVSAQIWSNLDHLATMSVRDREGEDVDENKSGAADMCVPSDYVLTQLEALGQILSYCLLEGGQGGLAPGPHPLIPTSQQNSIVANLVHVFGGAQNCNRLPASKDQLTSARRSLLSMTPRLVAALAGLWKAVVKSDNSQSRTSNRSWLVGSSKTVRGMILDLLSPLATVHPAHFLAALAVAWAEQGDQAGGRDVLVELVSSLKMFPTPTVIATTRQVLKSPPAVSGRKPVRLDVSVLELVSAYLSAASAAHLAESWPNLRDLLKDCLSSSPPCVFLAFEILHQAVIKGVSSSMEKRDSRDLQDMSTKLIESVSGIAGSMLDAGFFPGCCRAPPTSPAGHPTCALRTPWRTTRTPSRPSPSPTSSPPSRSTVLAPCCAHQRRSSARLPCRLQLTVASRSSSSRSPPPAASMRWPISAPSTMAKSWLAAAR